MRNGIVTLAVLVALAGAALVVLYPPMIYIDERGVRPCAILAESIQPACVPDSAQMALRLGGVALISGALFLASGMLAGRNRVGI